MADGGFFLIKAGFKNASAFRALQLLLYYRSIRSQVAEIASRLPVLWASETDNLSVGRGVITFLKFRTGYSNKFLVN